MVRLVIAMIAAWALTGPRQEEASVKPNDPLLPMQLSLVHGGGTAIVDRYSYRHSPDTLTLAEGIHLNVGSAWRLTTGSRSVVIAILDDGFLYEHEDLKENTWQNPGETGLDELAQPKAANGVDDDQNGYVDDVVGWDFVFNDPDPDCYIFDGMDAARVQPYHHGTAGAGIIGAKGNNGVGITGINWDTSLMFLKIGAQGIPRGQTDTLRAERAGRAIRYAVDNGARVINWSGNVSDHRPEAIEILRKAVEYAKSQGVLMVLAAGNSRQDLDIDENCTYPQCLDSENILNVAELDFEGGLVEFELSDGRVFGSNFGRQRVHLAAIGENYTTLVRHGTGVYYRARGTSNAAPVVSGVAGLVFSVRPDLDALAVKEVLLSSVTPLDRLEGVVFSGGMVNAHAAVQAALAYNRPEGTRARPSGDTLGK